MVAMPVHDNPQGPYLWRLQCLCLHRRQTQMPKWTLYCKFKGILKHVLHFHNVLDLLTLTSLTSHFNARETGNVFRDLFVDFGQLVEIVLEEDDFLTLSLHTYVAVFFVLNSTALNLNIQMSHLHSSLVLNLLTSYAQYARHLCAY